MQEGGGGGQAYICVTDLVSRTIETDKGTKTLTMFCSSGGERIFQ